MIILWILGDGKSQILMISSRLIERRNQLPQKMITDYQIC